MCELDENSKFDSLTNKINTLQVIIEMMLKYALMHGIYNGLVEEGLNQFKDTFEEHEETYKKLEQNQRYSHFVATLLVIFDFVQTFFIEKAEITIISFVDFLNLASFPFKVSN